MNGIKCYLSRAEVKKILADEVAKRLEPERLLGTCLREATLYDDGRVEVMFWTPESALGQEAQREAAAEKEREAKDAKDPKEVKDAKDPKDKEKQQIVQQQQTIDGPPRLFTVSTGR
jgi:hypothetical protein